MQESSYVTYEEDIKEGTVQKGDTCAIDYIGKKDGVAFEGGTGSYDLEIGSGSFIPGFEEGLIGKKIGSTVDLNLTFPENYGNEELNGQDVVFTVTIKKVTTRKVYKELTDELAATMDKTVKT
ncbi:MAG: FKBP-type peptidyl-prolyl cis-trans isomerase, partial [Clostridia bacterium]|nr:FKBP-type peptidyl-prolyl cis-trans isomerase [Clostridia bacterium]